VIPAGKRVRTLKLKGAHLVVELLKEKEGKEEK